MIAVMVHQEGLIYRNNFRVHLTVALDLSLEWQVIFLTRQAVLRTSSLWFDALFMKSHLCKRVIVSTFMVRKIYLNCYCITGFFLGKASCNICIPRDFSLAVNKSQTSIADCFVFFLISVHQMYPFRYLFSYYVVFIS